jgi:hypothetical protein
MCEVKMAISIRGAEVQSTWIALLCGFLCLWAILEAEALAAESTEETCEDLPTIKLCLFDGHLHGLWRSARFVADHLDSAYNPCPQRWHCRELSAIGVLAIASQPVMCPVERNCWTIIDGERVYISDDNKGGWGSSVYGFSMVLKKEPLTRHSNIVFQDESIPHDAKPSSRVVIQKRRQLDPIQKILIWLQDKHPSTWRNKWEVGIYYNFMLRSGRLDVWLYQGSALCGYRHVSQVKEAKKQNDPEHNKEPQALVKLPEGLPETFREWELIGVYPVKLKGDFSIIHGKTPLLLTAGGEVYRLKDKKAERIMSVWPASEDNKTSKTTDAGSSPLSRRLLLLEDQDRKKHVLFQWANKELTPLDVLDKEKQNIEPFLPAKDVDPKIIKAATVMLKQMQKDEQEVAEMKKELEAKRKAKAEEEAKKPKPQTLQERLQQN